MTSSERSSGNLLPPGKPGGRYRTVRLFGGLAFVSGHLPKVDGRLVRTGKVGADCSIADAKAAAAMAARGCLSSLIAHVGSLDAVDAVLKVMGFVASAPGFSAQTLVVDAASEAIIEHLGEERGHHARSAVGVAELPGGSPVEIEMICAVRI